MISSSLRLIVNKYMGNKPGQKWVSWFDLSFEKPSENSNHKQQQPARDYQHNVVKSNQVKEILFFIFWRHVFYLHILFLF